MSTAKPVVSLTWTVVSPAFAGVVSDPQMHERSSRVRPVRMVIESPPGALAPSRATNCPFTGRQAPASRRSRVIASRLPRIACCASRR